MIGTADTELVPGNNICFNAQGLTRYERAQNFYAFCEQDAVAKGTSLKWNYIEIPGVGHDGYALTSAKENATDVSSICETYLYDMPYHEPEKFPPTAVFNFIVNDTTKCVEFHGICDCHWQITPTTFTWNFGDGTIAVEEDTIFHTYSENGTYNVTLVVENEYGKDSITNQITISTLPEVNFTIN